MTYNVFGGTLNPTLLYILTQLFNLLVLCGHHWLSWVPKPSQETFRDCLQYKVLLMPNQHYQSSEVRCITRLNNHSN